MSHKIWLVSSCVWESHERIGCRSGLCLFRVTSTWKFEIPHHLIFLTILKETGRKEEGRAIKENKSQHEVVGVANRDPFNFLYPTLGRRPDLLTQFSGKLAPLSFCWWFSWYRCRFIVFPVFLFLPLFFAFVFSGWVLGAFLSWSPEQKRDQLLIFFFFLHSFSLPPLGFVIPFLVRARSRCRSYFRFPFFFPFMVEKKTILLVWW